MGSESYSKFSSTSDYVTASTSNSQKRFQMNFNVFACVMKNRISLSEYRVEFPQ